MYSSSSHCWLLDFDRTISSVEIVMKAVEHVCESLDLEYQKIDDQLKNAERHGRSFSVPVAVLSLWPEKYEDFCETLRNVDHLDSIFPDARLFIDKLVQTEQIHTIITYGDPNWQLLKIHFGQLDHIPHIICDTAEKSLLLNQYRLGGIFALPTSRGVLKAKTVTLVDDKPAAFENNCKDMNGILIERTGKTIKPPSGVRLIRTFDEIEV